MNNAEFKLMVLLVFALIVVPFAGFGINEFQVKQCRIEAIKAGVEADKINMACGVK